jgi:hypothetical protein
VRSLNICFNNPKEEVYARHWARREFSRLPKEENDLDQEAALEVLKRTGA